MRATGRLSSRDFSPRRARRVSVQQLELLSELLNTNRGIATAYNRSLLAKDHAKKKWIEIAEALNAQGDGAFKDWKGWSKFWVDFKAKLKSKVSTSRTSQGTGGGPSAAKPLTKIDRRFLQILGHQFAQGLPGARVELLVQPLDSDVTTESISSQSIIDINNTDHELPIIPPPTVIDLDSPPPSIHPDAQSTQTTTPVTHCAPPPTPPAPSETPPSNPALLRTRPESPRIAQSPRRKRLRREPQMSQSVARRALVQSSQMRAEAAVRTSEVMERVGQQMAEMVQQIRQFNNTALRIERILSASKPRDARSDDFA